MISILLDYKHIIIMNLLISTRMKSLKRLSLSMHVVRIKLYVRWNLTTKGLIYLPRLFKSKLPNL